MDKKSSATTDSRRGCAFGGSGKTEESVVRWGAVSNSVKVVVGFIQFSARQKISGLWVSMKSES